MIVRFPYERLCSPRIEYKADLTRLSLDKAFFTESSNKGVVVTTEYLRNINLYMNSEDPPFSILEQKIITDMNGFSQSQFNFMFELMNRKAVQFLESGLAQHLVDRYRIKRRPTSDDGPKILTLEHLNAGFYIFLACIAFAIFVFIIEIIAKKMSDAWLRSTRVLYSLFNAF